TLRRNVPFLHAAVLINDHDAIKRRIEDRLAVLFTGGKFVSLFSRELLCRFHQEIAKKLMNNSLGIASRRGVEFRDVAGKGILAINRDYLPDVLQSPNDLFEGVPLVPAMPR